MLQGEAVVTLPPRLPSVKLRVTVAFETWTDATVTGEWVALGSSAATADGNGGRLQACTIAGDAALAAWVELEKRCGQ